MFELAASYGTGEPVRIRNISEQHGVPARFLVQILLQLKGAGLVLSTRGAAGGYQLARPPQDISLGEVMAVIDGPEDPAPAAATIQSAASAVLASTWREVAQTQRQMLASISLADLVERARQQPQDMYYI